MGTATGRKAELATLVDDLDLHRPKRDAFQPALDAIARILAVGATLLQGSRGNAFLDDYLGELRVCQTFNIAETHVLDSVRAYTSTITTILTHSACLAQVPKLVPQIPALRMTLYEAIQLFVSRDFDLNPLRMVHALRAVGDAFLHAQGPKLLQAMQFLTTLIRPAMEDHPVRWADAFSLDRVSASPWPRHKRCLSIAERERPIVAALNRLLRRQKSELARPAINLTDVALISQLIVQLATALQRIRKANPPSDRSASAMIEQARRPQIQAGGLCH